MKHRGRLKLVTDLACLLVHKRIIIDKDFEKLINNILSKKYQNNKYYTLEDKV